MSHLRGIDVWDGTGLGEHVRITRDDGKEVAYADVVIRLRAMTQTFIKEVDRARREGTRGWQDVHAGLLRATLGKLDAVMEELDEDVTGAVDKVAAAVKAQAASAWRDWVTKNINAGARNAHRFLRLPDEWRPTTVLDMDGVTTAAPTELLRGYAKKYGALWNGDAPDAAGGDTDVPWRGARWEPLERPELGVIRAVARTFPLDTATAYDGLSMRHYAWLSDAALQLVADFIEIMERTGEMPQQLNAIAMPLLPKPRGGHRAVATFVSLYRLWNRIRRDEVRRWEASVDRPYFAAGSGRAPQDAVWRQAARAEAAVADCFGTRQRSSRP